MLNSYIQMVKKSILQKCLYRMYCTQVVRSMDGDKVAVRQEFLP